MNEPQTIPELEAALGGLACEMLDAGPDRWAVRNTETGSQTRLDAEDYASALFEAWNLMKP